MITLENFITLCNLEGVYFLISIEKQQCCWNIIIGNSPKIGKALDKLEPYYNKLVKNVNFNQLNENIIVSVEVE